jgi:hypothetical protein
MKNGVRDQIEHYNFLDLHHDNMSKQQRHPEIATAFDEIIAYYPRLHHSVVQKLTILCDIILELPEGTIWERNFKVVPDRPKGPDTESSYFLGDPPPDPRFLASLGAL